jgi:hypothetical protein
MGQREEKAMRERHCRRCGKTLFPGSLSYVVHIKVFADFDGVILESEEEIDQQWSRLMKQVDESDPEALEKEVHEELMLFLCKSCRDRFVDEIEHPWEGPLRVSKGSGDYLH